MVSSICHQLFRFAFHFQYRYTTVAILKTTHAKFLGIGNSVVDNLCFLQSAL